jgi:hypothetical protein
MATAPATPIRQDWRGKMAEVKAPEMFQFSKQGQTVEGVLVSIEPVEVKGKQAIEYLFANEKGERTSCLGTADLNKKIHPGHIGHWLAVRYEADDSTFQKEGQSAMKKFRVQASEGKAPGF